MQSLRVKVGKITQISPIIIVICTRIILHDLEAADDFDLEDFTRLTSELFCFLDLKDKKSTS